MLFVDLVNFKIKKEFQFQNIAILVSLPKKFTLQDVKNAVDARLPKLFELKPVIGCNYEIFIKTADGEEPATEEQACDFLTIVNVATACFFAQFVEKEGRQRERRLDVPESLKALKVNMTLLKRAINHKTKADLFNLIIHYKDLTYVMCDEKDLPTKDFKHTVDELEAPKC